MYNQLLGRNRGIQSLLSLLSEVLTTFGMHKLGRAGKRRRQNNWRRSSLFIANGSYKWAMFYSCCEINWHCWHIVGGLRGRQRYSSSSSTLLLSTSAGSNKCEITAINYLIGETRKSTATPHLLLQYLIHLQD
jgi:hypothetical protein